MAELLQLARGEKLDAKMMLLRASENADDYEQVVIMAKRKDTGKFDVWSIDDQPWFYFGCSVVLSDLATRALHGEIEKL